MPKDEGPVERRKGPNAVLYTAKEFKNWYGSEEQWHTAPGENDDGNPLEEMLHRGQRAKGHAYLEARGVTDEEHRARIMHRIVPDPKRTEAIKKESQNTWKDNEHYPAAAAAIAAGEVAFVTVADASDAHFAANLVRSLDRCADAEVGLVGETLPLSVHCIDEASHERLSAFLASSSTNGRTAPARLVSLHQDAALAQACTHVGAAERREWLTCTAIARALDTHAYVVYVDASTCITRHGAAALCVEGLAAAAGDEAAAWLLQDAQKHTSEWVHEAAKAKVELLMSSAGINDAACDGPLGLRWQKLMLPPADGEELIADARTPRAERLDALRAALHARGAILQANDQISFAEHELRHIGALELQRACYVAAGKGSGRCYFQVAGRGLSSRWIAARHTEATAACFSVDGGGVTAGWSLEQHLNSYMLGRVVHRGLPLSIYAHGQYWLDEGVKKRLKEKTIIDSRRVKVLAFGGGFLESKLERRLVMEREESWFLGDAWEGVMRAVGDGAVVDEDDDEDETVIV